MARQYTDFDLGLLYSRSAGLCNRCRNPVFVPTVDGNGYINIGEIAHNLPYSVKGPRGTEIVSFAITIDEYSPDNSYNNLILLCRNHHKIVDKDAHYSVEQVKRLKNDHEDWVTNSLYPKINSDQSLVALIHQHINFQHLIYELNDPLYGLPFDLVDIGDIDSFLLQANTPQFYPFNNSELTSLMESILACFYTLSPYIQHNYELRNGNRLILFRQVSEQEANDIRTYTSNLRTAIFNWIEYCRTNNLF